MPCRRATLLTIALLTAATASAEYQPRTQPFEERDGVLAPAALHDEGCLACHGVGDLKTIDALTGHEYKLALDIPGYLRSRHGHLRCKACHKRGYDAVPHRGSRRRDAFACLYCHRDDEVFADIDVKERRRQVEASVHHEKLREKVVRGQAVGFDCNRCHDPHLFRPRDPGANQKERTAWTAAVCGRCHGEEGGLRPFEAAVPALDAHPFWPHLKLHLATVPCTACHTQRTEQHRILPAAEAVRECRSCHSKDPKLLQALFGTSASSGVADANPEADSGRPGILNDQALDEVYVVGATRSLWLDRVALWASMLLSLLLLGHALVATRFRRVLRQQADDDDDPDASRPHFRGTAGPYPRWVRVWHVLSVPVFLGLLLSGLALHYPDGFGQLLGFRWAVLLHNALGVAMVASLALFLIFNLATSNKRHYRPRRMLRAATLRQLRYYVTGYLRGEPFPFRRGRRRKFNPLQQLSYLLVMYLVLPVSAVTGVLLFFPELAPDRVAGAGGVWPMALVHLGAAWLLSSFLALHVYMITTGPTLLFYLRELMGQVAPPSGAGTSTSNGDGTKRALPPRVGGSNGENV